MQTPELHPVKITHIVLASRGQSKFIGEFTSVSERFFLKNVPRNIDVQTIRLRNSKSVILQASILRPNEISNKEHEVIVYDSMEYKHTGVLLDRKDQYAKILSGQNVIEFHGSFTLTYVERDRSVPLIRDWIELVISSTRSSSPLSAEKVKSLTFKAPGLYWTGYHSIEIDFPNNRIKEWIYSIRIENQTEMSFSNVDLTLISSSEEEPGYVQSRSLYAASPMGVRSEEKSTGNIIVPVGEVGEIRTGESVIAIFRIYNVPIVRQYVYNLRSGDKHPRNIMKFAMNNDTRISLPAARGEWFVDDLNDFDSGSLNIEYLAPGQETNVDLGPMSLVEVDFHEIVREEDNRMVGNIKFTNHSTVSVTIYATLDNGDRSIKDVEFDRQYSVDDAIVEFFENDDEHLSIISIVVPPQSFSSVSYSYIRSQ